MEKEPITLNGLNNLKEELTFLKEKKRPEIVAAIAEARSHGDLKENAEYHAAREQQSFIEGRIQEIDGKLSNAEIIDVAKLNAGDRVVFGATVKSAPSNHPRSSGRQRSADYRLQPHHDLRTQDNRIDPSMR